MKREKNHTYVITKLVLMETCVSTTSTNVFELFFSFCLKSGSCLGIILKSEIHNYFLHL